MQKSTLVFLGLLAVFVYVNGHGRLIKPAGRATLWRYSEFFKFSPAQNYNDMECFCGGFDTQYIINGGKCGICGDSYSDPQPRAHEGGGTYGRGIITGTYSAGQVIEVQVELTASHLGYFEFRLCPHNNPLVPATQECLDENLLELASGSGTQYPIGEDGTRVHTVALKLPNDLTCEQCVLQWHYWTGNRWGPCDDGTERMGCGDQETFRGCADIQIN